MSAPRRLRLIFQRLSDKTAENYGRSSGKFRTVSGIQFVAEEVHAADKCRLLYLNRFLALDSVGIMAIYALATLIRYLLR
jgi:hypothetical protein